MTTKFGSVEEAKQAAAMMAGRKDLKEVRFEKVEGLHVEGMVGLLDNPTTPEEVKKKIGAGIESQQGFEFQNCNGKEVRIVIGPFRDGYDCWLLGDNGFAVRL